MTSRTHDLAAFTALSVTFAVLPLVQMTPATLFVAIFSNMIGGLIPDLDNHTSEIWNKIRGGQFVAAVVSPLFGGHRNFSHSILGTLFFGYVSQLFLDKVSTILIVNMDIVWYSFMIGLISHLVMDAITKEGIPLFFPASYNIGFPPIKALRFRTGSIGENLVVLPSLLILNCYLFYQKYDKLLLFLKEYLN